MNINNFPSSNEIEYVVMDPSKNITILVLTQVPKIHYESVSKKLLEAEKSAEQVGFLTYDDKCDITMEMAGGEFCGNATMSAAVYFAMEKGIKSGTIKVLACEKPVNVEVKLVNDKEEGSHSSPVHNVYEGIVEMPRAKEVKAVKFPSGETFPVLFFEGIAHIIFDISTENVKICNCDNSLITGTSSLSIKDNEKLRQHLECNIKSWCNFLKMPALGVMVCDGGVKSEISMTPLVYVKSVDTLYWESSCASGTTAVGAYFTKISNKSVTINVWQASGTKLIIESDESGRLRLKGQVKYLYTKRMIV